MKKMKKVLAMLLSFIMMMSMAMTTFAAGETGSIVYHTGKHNVQGVAFNAYRLMDATVSEGNIAYQIHADFTEFFKDKITANPEKTDDELATEYLKNNVSTSKFQKALKSYITSKPINAVATQNGSDGHEYNFSSLPYGYYAIIPNETQLSPSFTTVSSTVAQNVYLKGKEPGVDKKVDDADWTSAQIGDTVKFTVESSVPNMTGFDTYTFKLTDTMSNGLTVTADTLKAEVKIGNTILKSNQFTISVEGQKITIEIKDFINYKEQANEAIVFTYYAVLNKYAVSTKPETNTANVHYGNNPNQLTNGTPDIVYVHTHKLTINKVDNKESGLGGAEFQLYRGTEVTETPIKFVDLKNGTYRVAKEGEVTTTDKLISPTTGIITIEGLDDGDYCLVETKAPDGFNKLKKPIKIHIQTSTTSNGQQVTVEGTTQKVINNPGTVLPETGGMGTVLFTVTAIVLVIGVIVSFVFSRRKSRR